MLTIAYITDLHIDEANPATLGADTRRNWLLIYQDLLKRPVDLIVLGGDLGEAEALPWLLNFMEGYTWHVTPGNHDVRAELRKYYHNPETDVRHAFYFGFDKDGHRYIFLDTQPDLLDDIQLAWLEAHIETEMPLIIFMHHPVLPVDTWVDQHYPLNNRERVEAIIRKHAGAVSIFCGHYHMEHKQTAGQITQYICPAVSFQISMSRESFLPDISSTAYQIIRVDENAVQREVVRIPLT